MPELPLKNVQDKVLTPSGEVSSTTLKYGSIFLAVLSDGSAKGISIDDMRQRLPLMGKIEQAVKDGLESVPITVLEHRVLITCMKQFRFRVVSAALVGVLEELEGLQ